MSRAETEERNARDRFHATVQRAGPDECWMWGASVSWQGYGRFSWCGRGRQAHRIAWELAFGPIPDGLFVCHRCDVRACCNPTHLFLGTSTDNIHDMIAKGRDSHGERSNFAKLTEAQVRDIRARLSAGERSSALAREYGVHYATLRRIATGRLWASIAPREVQHAH